MILVHILRHWITYLFEFNLDLISEFFCAFNDYQIHVFGCLSLWMLFIISIDRLVTIAFPDYSRLFKQRWFQAAMVLIIFIYSVLINIRLPLNTRLVFINETNSTATKWICLLPDEILLSNTILFLVNIFLVNIVLNNILHAKMIRFIYQSRKKLSNRHLSRTAIKDRKFAMTTVGLNIGSFMSKVPVAIIVFILNLYNLDKEVFQMAFSIIGIVAILDDIDLFFINIFFNSIFYDEFCEMIGIKKANNQGSSS